jgi:hypothetical protein
MIRVIMNQGEATPALNAAAVGVGVGVAAA